MKPEPIPYYPKLKLFAFVYGLIWMGVISFFLLPADVDPGELLNTLQQNARTISHALVEYSFDHEGHYPVGKTSTEVFQLLLDKHYVTDENVFYAPLPGKVQPLSTVLRPENIVWDLSDGIDPGDSERLPVVFLTGYTITYEAGAAAVPLPVPAGSLGHRIMKMFDDEKPFMVVGFKNYSAIAVEAAADGSIPNFIPADFDARGRVFRQLRP